MIIFAFDPGARWTGHGSIVGTVGGKNKSLTRYHISRRQTLIQNVFIWMRINESTFGFFRTLQKWTFVLFLSPNIRTNLELKPSVVTFLSHFELIALGQFYHISFLCSRHWRGRMTMMPSAAESLSRSNTCCTIWQIWKKLSRKYKTKDASDSVKFRHFWTTKILKISFQISTRKLMRLLHYMTHCLKIIQNVSF